MEFPELSNVMVGSLITIATFDVMPADNILDKTLGIPDDEREEDKFTDVGIEGHYMILNLGTIFLVLVITLMMPIFLICVKPCVNKKQKWKKKHKGCVTSMKGNVFIRFFLEGCLDIVLCGALNIIYIQENDIGYEFHTLFHITNSISLFALGLVIVTLPIWTLWFYCRNFKNW